MRLHTILVAVLVLAAAPAMSAGRFYCATDDAALKMSLEIEFSDDRGGKLAHFRGVAALKGETVPKSLRFLNLDSKMLTQSWSDDKALLLRLNHEVDTGAAFTSLDMTIIATPSKKGKATYDGVYTTMVRGGKTRDDAAAAAAAAVKARGKIACQVKSVLEVE